MSVSQTRRYSDRHHCQDLLCNHLIFKFMLGFFDTVTFHPLSRSTRLVEGKIVMGLIGNSSEFKKGCKL